MKVHVHAAPNRSAKIVHAVEPTVDVVEADGQRRDSAEVGDGSYFRELKFPVRTHELRKNYAHVQNLEN